MCLWRIEKRFFLQMLASCMSLKKRKGGIGGEPQPCPPLGA